MLRMCFVSLKGNDNKFNLSKSEGCIEMKIHESYCASVNDTRHVSLVIQVTPADLQGWSSQRDRKPVSVNGLQQVSVGLLFEC